MTELSWSELFPPREVTLADVTATMRVLAGRPRRGVQRLTPVVAFELWLRPGRVRWLLGMDPSLASHLPAELRAQLPGLGLLRLDPPQRPVPTTARELRCDRLSFPLRLDTAGAVAAGVMQLAAQLGRHETAVVQWVIGPSHTRTRQPAQFNAFEALGLRSPSPPDSSQRQAWKAKTAEPLFGVRGRIGATAGSASRAGAIMRPLLSALSLANGPHAGLRASRQSSRTAQQLSSVLGRARTWSGIVNAAELAVLLAWPLDGLVVPGHGVSLGLTPTPLLRDDKASTSASDDERLLGRSLHPASAGQLVRLPTVSCLSHVHVIGPTGTGKSTALAQWITTDATAGRSVLVLEPKGDLVADVLARLPVSRQDDVVVIEPGDAETTVGFNPLAGPRDQAERRADELLGLFRELFGTAIGPRSSDVLLHALITAARLSDGTLTDVPALLTNPGFRRRALAQVSDPLVLAPFWAWFDSISDAERAQVVAPVMNKLRVLVSRPAIRRMLGQAAPRFALDELFTKRRIVLVNLNQGGIGPETARLLGALLLQQLWRAVQRRAQVPAVKRHPVMVVIDEFQDFVGALDFGDVLAQARGLGVSITAAHQHLRQLAPSLRAAVLANARSRLVFRPAHDDAKALADVLGETATPADLERLGAFQAAARVLVLVKSAPSAAFAVQTLPLGESTSDATALRAQSAARYGLPAAELDAALTARWQGTDRPPDAPVGITRGGGRELAYRSPYRSRHVGRHRASGNAEVAPGTLALSPEAPVSGRAARLQARLGERDLAVLASLAKLRLLTGKQLQRLHVSDGSPLTQARRARALLQRLTELRLVVRLARRIGGIRAGSEGHLYGLSGLGQAVLGVGGPLGRRRRSVWETKPWFQDHTLAISELYVRLVEISRQGTAELLAFDAEPACWRCFTGIGGQRVVLKPDASVRLGTGEYEQRAFIELDLASEHLPTITRKCQRYLAYWHSGLEQRASGVFPRVWWLVPTLARAEGIASVIARLADSAHHLFRVALSEEAPELLTTPPAAEAIP